MLTLYHWTNSKAVDEIFRLGLEDRKGSCTTDRVFRG